MVHLPHCSCSPAFTLLHLCLLLPFPSLGPSVSALVSCCSLVLPSTDPLPLPFPLYNLCDLSRLLSFFNICNTIVMIVKLEAFFHLGLYKWKWSRSVVSDSLHPKGKLKHTYLRWHTPGLGLGWVSTCAWTQGWAPALILHHKGLSCLTLVPVLHSLNITSFRIPIFFFPQNGLGASPITSICIHGSPYYSIYSVVIAFCLFSFPISYNCFEGRNLV